MSRPERIVVVGGGVAGLRTAEALRRNGFTGELIGVSAERRPPYARPPLSKAALSDPEWECAALTTTSGVRWRLGTEASGLDLTARRVELADGSGLTFDAVVLATGVRARTPPELRSGLSLRTAEDATRLRAVLRSGPGHLVVVGAGFVGSEVAAAARQAGWTVTVVDGSSAPLARALGPGPARWLWDQHRARGVRTRFGEPVRSVEPTDAGCRVVLGSGPALAGDAVVTGLGTVPNTEWLHGTGLDLTDGVLTDAAGRAVTTEGVALGNVVAVGDLARTPSRLAGHRAIRHEHWTAATSGAQRVAATLTGGQAPPATPPVFWTGVYGDRVQVVGHPEGTESEPERGPRGFCVRYRSETGVLTAAVVVNWPQRLLALNRELSEAGRVT